MFQFRGCGRPDPERAGDARAGDGGGERAHLATLPRRNHTVSLRVCIIMIYDYIDIDTYIRPCTYLNTKYLSDLGMS